MSERESSSRVPMRERFGASVSSRAILHDIAEQDRAYAVMMRATSGWRTTSLAVK